MNKKPDAYLLTETQAFELAKMFVEKNDEKGFNDMFVLMTRPMRRLLKTALAEAS